jgi:glycosyltransferase involved in cell wall biosynthesis
MKDQLTIALPVYKRTDFVKAALDSAVNQTVECSILLIDNNSPHHDFKTIVEAYKRPNMEYVRMEETVPQDENFNNCFRLAKTPWVTVLHDDDMLHCQYVEFSQKLIENYGDELGGIIYGTYVGEEEWKDVGQQKELSSDIRKLNPAYFHFRNVPFPGVLVKTNTALKLGGFTNDLHPIADFDFWLRYSKEEQFFFVNQLMSYFRISPTQSTNHLIDAMVNDIYEYRLREIRASRHNNTLALLGMEHARITNLEYFRNTYESIQIPEDIVNQDKMEKARKRMANPLLRKVVERYVRKVSFSAVRPIK